MATAWGKPKSRAVTIAGPVSLLEVMTETKTDADEQASIELARKLQFEEESGISLEAVAVEDEVTAEEEEARPDNTTINDHELAMLLQAEFDCEHDEQISAVEQRANRKNGCGSSNIRLSYDLHRSPYPAERKASPNPEEGESDDDYETEMLTYDKARKVYRGQSGEIFTKHNAKASSTNNGMKLMESLPLSFSSGDTGKGKRNKPVRVNNKVFNEMMTHAVKHEKSRHRRKEKKDTSTSDMALDSKTRLLLFRMVNAKILDEVNGACSTGKEAIVFHATRHTDPDDAASAVEEVAIKVFKTTVTEFKQRQQFLHGDRRYDGRVGRQSARQLVKLWAEKEAANLARMERAGMNCPRVVIQHKHVLVMSFIGADAKCAPKLKEAQLSRKAMANALAQIRDGMQTMYNDCKLVHADLSEYNLLWYKKQVYFIDVGQSVIPTHPRADEFLFRDCVNIARFFKGSETGDAAECVPEDLFRDVTGRDITSELAAQYVQTLNVSKRAPKNRLLAQNAQDTSDVCVTHDMEREIALAAAADFGTMGSFDGADGGGAAADAAAAAESEDSDGEVPEVEAQAALIAALKRADALGDSVVSATLRPPADGAGGGSDGGPSLVEDGFVVVEQPPPAAVPGTGS